MMSKIFSISNVVRMCALLAAFSLPLQVSAQSAARRFPSIDLGSLNPSQQAQFIDIVDSELCPCEGEVKTLAECLEVPNGTCGLARQAVTRIQQGLNRNETSAQISHGIAQHLRVMQTEHRFSLRGAFTKGAQNPKVTIVVFADFQCPACRQFARVADEIVAEFPNDVQVVAMHFPLTGHQNAMPAAIAAQAAGLQGKFWEFHDALFASQQTLSRASDPMAIFLYLVQDLGLDRTRFLNDYQAPTTASVVQSQRAAALRAQATGTPAVFVNGVRFHDIDRREALTERVQTLIRESSR